MAFMSHNDETLEKSDRINIEEYYQGDREPVRFKPGRSTTQATFFFFRI